jgi:hypothetical protein
VYLVTTCGEVYLVTRFDRIYLLLNTFLKQYANKSSRFSKENLPQILEYNVHKQILQNREI